MILKNPRKISRGCACISPAPSSPIQTILSAPESHRVSLRSRALRIVRITAGREFHPALKISVIILTWDSPGSQYHDTVLYQPFHPCEKLILQLFCGLVSFNRPYTPNNVFVWSLRDIFARPQRLHEKARRHNGRGNWNTSVWPYRLPQGASVSRGVRSVRIPHAPFLPGRALWLILPRFQGFLHVLRIYRS
jgi:hypothetical protein